MTRILLTGVRGKTGVPLAELLSARAGAEVLGGSSDPSAVSIEGVTPTPFSWDDPSRWPDALDGTDAVYLVRPDRADAPELIEKLLAVTPASVHTVLLSEREADYEALDRWALRCEHAVREGARSWTILRPSWFMQVFTDPRFYLDAIAAGELAFPSGGASIAWLDARDIAAVAGQALLGEGHAGRTYELSGPESLSLARTAELLSAAIGHHVEPREVTIEAALDGLEGFDRELTELTFERVQAGSFTPVTDTVERVTGRPPRTLEDFAAENHEAFRRAG